MNETETLQPPLSEADYSIPGMRVQAGGPGDPWALVVRCAAPQAGWVAEPQGAANRNSVIVTPTTILYQGLYYRIHEEEPAVSGWIYRMQPCPEGEIMHQVIELERGKVLQAATEEREFRKLQTLAHHSGWYEILLGWLPARWQESLSERWHFSPKDASRKNALAQAFIALGASLPTIIEAAILGGSRTLVFLYCGLMMEGALRWSHVAVSENPCGFLPLEIADRAIRTITRLLGRMRR